jgi:hypothetical protein
MRKIKRKHQKFVMFKIISIITTTTTKAKIIEMK